MNAADVVAVAHDGELVCEDCCDDIERAVFRGAPHAAELCERDGYLSVVFADQVEPGDCCDRCGELLPGAEADVP